MNNRVSTRGRTSPAAAVAPRRPARQSPARAFRRPTPTTLHRDPGFHALNRTEQSAFLYIVGRLQYEGTVQLSHRQLGEKLGGRAIVGGRRQPACPKTAQRAVAALVTGGWIEVRAQRVPGQRDRANVIALGPRGRAVVGLSPLTSGTNLSTPSVGAPEGHTNSDVEDPQADHPALRGGADAPPAAGSGAGEGEDGEGRVGEDVERTSVRKSLPPRPNPRRRGGRRPDPAGELLQQLRKGLAGHQLTPADERMLVKLSRLCPPAYRARLVGLTGYVRQHGEGIGAVGALLRSRLVDWMLSDGAQIPGEWREVAEARGAGRYRPEAPRPGRSAEPSTAAITAAAVDDREDLALRMDRIEHVSAVLGDGAGEHAAVIGCAVDYLPWSDVAELLSSALEASEDPERGATGDAAGWFRTFAMWDLDAKAGVNLYNWPAPVRPVACSTADGQHVQQLVTEAYEDEPIEWREESPEHHRAVLAWVRREARYSEATWNVRGRALRLHEIDVADLAADFALAVAVARSIETDTGTAFTPNARAA